MLNPDEIKKHLDMVSEHIDQLKGLKNSLLMVNLFHEIQAFLHQKNVDSLFIFLSHLDGERKISTHHNKDSNQITLSLFQFLEIGNGAIRGQGFIKFSETVSVFLEKFENFTFHKDLALDQFLHNHCPEYCLKIYLSYYLNYILPEKNDQNQVKI